MKSQIYKYRYTDEKPIELKWPNMYQQKCFSAKRQGRFQKKNLKNGWINPSGLAGWGQQGAKIQPKKIVLKKIQR